MSIKMAPSSVSSSYSSPPWLGAVKFFRPPFFAFPIISPSSLPLHSGGAWLWGWFSRGRLSIASPCGRFKDGSRIEASSPEWVQPTAERGGFPLCYVCCFVFFCLLACFLRFGHVCFFMRLNLST
jgi:hypothetical protein